MTRGIMKLVLSGIFILCSVLGERKFEVDYENDQFLMDGKPFVYVAGEIHYFRFPRQYWRDRLEKIRAIGINAISIYTEWSTLEPAEGQYDFTGNNDFIHFINLADELGMYVIFRPGPFICAERDMGGFPSWLLRDNRELNLRTSDPVYKYYVGKWFRVLLPMIEPLLYGNGGPIIMVQVENEYGYHPACDRNYTAWLRDLYLSYVGDKTVLFTVDGAGEEYVRCGQIPGVFTTVDFGVGFNLDQKFEESLRKFQPHGPPVIAELYTGWMVHWGDPPHKNYSLDLKKDLLKQKPLQGFQHTTTSTSALVKTIDLTLQMGGSISLYMIYGGTNFGFTSGMNYDLKIGTTSYDYDAPLTEAGDPNQKYFALREVIGKYLPLPDLPLPQVMKKGYYGRHRLVPLGDILSPKIRKLTATNSMNSNVPLTFEEMEQNYGFILYETTLPHFGNNCSDMQQVLYTEGIRDLGYVFIDEVPQGKLIREFLKYSVSLNSKVAKGGHFLQIFVENQGRINFGVGSADPKGIVKEVKLNEVTLYDWTTTSFPLDDVSQLLEMGENDTLFNIQHRGVPMFYYTDFVINEGTDILDTYIDTSGWGKGVIWINGFNLGRYWPKRGPQKTLYIPGVYINPPPQKNTILIFEQERPKTDLIISFTVHPVVD